MQHYCNTTRGGVTSIAEAVGVSKQYISGIKKEKEPVTELTKQKIIQYFIDIKYDYIDWQTKYYITKNKIEILQQQLDSAQEKIEYLKKIIKVQEQIIEILPLRKPDPK